MLAGVLSGPDARLWGKSAFRSLCLQATIRVPATGFSWEAPIMGLMPVLTGDLINGIV